MAFAARYKGRLFSRDGNAYQAWLLDESGDPAETVVLTDEAATLSWGKRGSDIYTPVLASHASVQNWRLASAPSGYIDGDLAALIGSRTGTFRLQIRQGASQAAIDADGATLYWTGLVLPDGYADTTTADPHRVDVQAVDGLGTLKEIGYVDTSTPTELNAYTGVESYKTILIRALGKLGYALPIRSALAWRPDGETGDPLAEITVDNAAFYDEGGGAMTCYQVVEEICRRMGARICQWCEDGDEAAWWIVSRELMTGSTYTAYYYDAAGSAETPATASVGAAVAGGTPVEGRRTYRTGWGAVAVVQEHGTVPPLIDEALEAALPTPGLSARERQRFRVENPPRAAPGTWSYTGDAEAQEAPASTVTRVDGSGSAAVARGNLVHAVNSFKHGSDRVASSVKASVAAQDWYAERTGGQVTAGQTTALTGSVRITHDEGALDGVYQTYWSLVIDGTNHYAKRDGTWAESADEATRMQYMVEPPESGRWGEQGLALETDVPFTFVFAAAPATGDVVLRLYGSSDYSATLSKKQPGYVQWDNVAVVIADSAGEALGATRTEAVAVASDVPRADPVREDITVRTGEGPSQALPTTILWDGAATSNDWTSARLTSPRSLDALHSQTVLRSQANPLENRTETYRGVALSPIAPLSNTNPAGGTGYYVPQYLARRLYSDEVEGEWVELAWDASVSINSASAAGDPEGTTYSAPTGGTGTAAPSAGSTPSPVTTEGDLIVGDSEGDEARLAIGTTGQILTSDGTTASWEDPAAQSPITTEGDLVRGDGSGDPERLAIGTDGYVLTSNGTTAAWAAPTVADEDALAQSLTPVIGRATIANTETEVTVTPGVSFNAYAVQVTPASEPEDTWHITDVSTTAFKITLASAATGDNDFNWAVWEAALPAPENLSAVAADGEVELTFDDVPTADGYEIHYDTDSGVPYANTTGRLAESGAPGNGLTDNLDGTWSYTVTGLTNSTLYYFSVQSYKDS